MYHCSVCPPAFPKDSSTSPTSAKFRPILPGASATCQISISISDFLLVLSTITVFHFQYHVKKKKKIATVNIGNVSLGLLPEGKTTKGKSLVASTKPFRTPFDTISALCWPCLNGRPFVYMLTTSQRAPPDDELWRCSWRGRASWTRPVLLVRRGSDLEPRILALRKGWCFDQCY